MNDDFDNLYELTDAEASRNRRGAVTWLLYMVLTAVILITGAHAVMLVLSQTAAYSFGDGSNLITTLLTAIRVAFPLIVELSAVVAGVGFITARWHGPQKYVGLAIELVWLTFAAANMMTFFAVERGADLQPWQVAWVQYGLPLSALVAGSLTYILLRVDPAHRRDEERAATAERVDAMKFKFRQKALLSPALLNIERQRAFMQVIEQLRRDGYTDAQIRFMIQHTPELMADGDENGTPDALEIGRVVPMSSNTHEPMRPMATPGQGPDRGQGEPAAVPQQPQPTYSASVNGNGGPGANRGGDAPRPQ